MKILLCVVLLAALSASALQRARDTSACPIVPLPKTFSSGTETFQLSPTFSFELSQRTQQSRLHSFFESAFRRFNGLIFAHGRPERLNFASDVTVLHKLQVSVESEDTSLSLQSDESYTLDITSEGVVIHSKTCFGALRGLQSFSQLVSYCFETDQYMVLNGPWQIKDAPRFAFRGLLLDTSRHFFPISTIQTVIDSMEHAKLNVLHWHIVDAQSFPMQSLEFPKLWEGAWSSGERYSQKAIRFVVEYARQRGVIVMPEFDAPGHMYAWGIGYPQVLPQGWQSAADCENQCPPQSGNPCNVPIDPSEPFSYTLVDGVLKEVTVGRNGQGLFNSELIHLGGDEVEDGCWRNSQQIKDWMVSMNFTDYNSNYLHFVNFTHNTALKYGRTPVAWEEVFVNFGKKLNPKTIIHIWKDFDTLAQVVEAGYRAILSNSDVWYLDHLETPWTDFYNNEPLRNITDPEQQALVTGGEVCMWSETVDPSDLHNTIWPRAAAAAERLWSPQAVSDPNQFIGRLQRFRCLLLQRGIGAGPINQAGRAAPVDPGACALQ
eukprot:GILJ01009788.1.p1 GENE.GILJ01009788.1~~GILJ01009788.1.p1  ORF type:complete len:559 (-),score=60.15 GILJ01009788.1:148-1788(-)